jgi:hypothetical protein
LLAGQLTNVVRVYEGYPLVRFYDLLNDFVDRLLANAFLNRMLAKLGVTDSGRTPAPGIAAHQGRCSRLRERSASSPSTTSPESSSEYGMRAALKLYDNYPPNLDRVMPTTLGNIIRAAEDYGYDRYGFEIIYLWSRLAAVLPAEYLTDVERSIIEYQAPLMVSFGSAILAVSSLFLVMRTISTIVVVLMVAGSSMLSWIAYRLAFQPAKDYGDLLRTAVDLFRKDLLERWWPELLAVDDDRVRLEILREFVITGRKRSIASIAARDPAAGGLLVVEGRPSIPSASSAGQSSAAISTWSVGRCRFRWSNAFLVVVVASCGWTTHVLNQGLWVLVAKHNIGAFSYLGSNDVEVTSARRGSVPRDALASSENKNNVQPDPVTGKLALRGVGAGKVLRRSDIGPPEALSKPSGVIIEIVRRRMQVAALDLRPGDLLLLTGIHESAGCPGQVTATTATAGARTGSGAVRRSVKGEVLAIVDTNAPDTVSVVVQVDADGGESLCLGDLSQAEILRQPT